MSFKRVPWWVVAVWAGSVLGGGTSSLAQGGVDPNLVDEVVLLRHWVPAEYPADALKEKLAGDALIRFVSDETGKVISARALEASDERFAQAAIVAVRQWEVEPMQVDGRAVASGLDAYFDFDPKNRGKFKAGDTPPISALPRPSPTTPAAVGETPEGKYPPTLAPWRLNGRVAFRGVVTETGKVKLGQVLRASHPDFVLPAIESLASWTFTPAKQGDLAVESETEGVVTFTALETAPEEVLAACKITGPDGKPPERALAVAEACETVWPLERLLAGESGRAVVEFDVLETGQVAQVVSIEATAPEFSAAAKAAMEAWIFAPAPESSGPFQFAPVPLTLERQRLRRTVELVAPRLARESGDPIVRVAAAWQAGEIGGAKGLDEKLTPIHRVAPVYPRALKSAGAPAGRAVIEFVIDREGRVRLPHAVEATQEEFGWAAATAVAQWVFRSPRRGGEPVDVKVRIPIDFAAPKA